MMAHSPCSQAVGGWPMISIALVLISAAMSMQASDTTRAARESFTHCLRAFVDHSTADHKTLDQFTAAFPPACAPGESRAPSRKAGAAEQTPFRQAIIQRDMASRSTRASAEESANLEVDDAR